MSDWKLTRRGERVRDAIEFILGSAFALWLGWQMMANFGVR